MLKDELSFLAGFRKIDYISDVNVASNGTLEVIPRSIRVTYKVSWNFSSGRIAATTTPYTRGRGNLGTSTRKTVGTVIKARGHCVELARMIPP